MLVNTLTLGCEQNYSNILAREGIFLYPEEAKLFTVVSLS